MTPTLPVGGAGNSKHSADGTDRFVCLYQHLRFKLSQIELPNYIIKNVIAGRLLTEFNSGFIAE